MRCIDAMRKEADNKTAIETPAPAVGCLVSAAAQSMLGALTRALTEADVPLTAPEYLVMRAIYSRDGLQQCEIAELTGKDKATICRCVASLARKGLVRTEQVSHKCLRVYVAQEGRRIERDVMRVAAERHAALQSLLAPGEMSTFKAILSRIIATHRQS